MSLVRNRARLIAVLTLMWQVMGVAVVSAAFACEPSRASEHAGMADCPLHDNAPVCPLHADKHGTHECDCPTIGCADPDTQLTALFGAVGILADTGEMLVPADAGDASGTIGESLNSLASAPLAPPPRT